MKAKYNHFSRILGIILAVCLLVTSFTFPATANEGTEGSVEDLINTYNGSDLLVGAAVQDITPTSEMLPIAWGRAGYLVGVIDDLHVRVIALNDGDSTSLIINFETGKGPYPPVFLNELAEHTGVAEENIFWSTTHCHAAPEITTDIDLESDDNISKWGRLVMAQMKVAADEAIANMEPAEIGIGYTNSYINVNRNTAYTSADGTVTRAEGYNGEGDSDKLLTVIQFNSLATSEPIAFIVHHATHGVVMYGNQYFDSDYEGINYTADEKFAGDTNGVMGIHPDFPGLVSNYLEEYYDGCVALWMSGAAGDQNPIVRNELFTANPETGEKESTYISGGSVEICEYLAKIQFADVLTTISTIDEFNSEVSVTTVSGSTDVPGQEGYDDVPMYLRVMRIGDIALVGNPGELFNSIGVYMQENSILEHTLVVNHCWTSAEQSPSYFTDDYGLINGGPNTNATYAVGYINEYMTTLMNNLIEQTNWVDNGDGTATSNETGETVIVGLDGDAGTEDDNRVVNPAGKVLLEDVNISYDSNGTVYVALGNGFKLYGGEDGLIGTGDDIVAEFGSYAQSDSTGATKNPLNWRLLDITDGEAVLIAEHSIDAILFNLDDNSASNAWIDSNLRSWLNSRGGTAYNAGANDDTAGFYDTAFTDAEKQLINLSDIKMDYSDQELWDTSLDDYNGTTGTYPAYDRVLYATGTTSPWVLTTTTGESTQDYVYAISGEEYFEYFGAGYLEGDGWELANYRDGYFSATEYAKARGAKNSSTQGLTDLADSWARSPGRDGLDANGNAYGVFWSGTGSMNVGREVNNSQSSKTYGIIPMIRVNLGAYDSDWTYNGDGTATSTDTNETVIVGLDGEAGTEDDNKVVNPSGKVLLGDVAISYDSDGIVYVDLGNGFNLYGGVDGLIGTTDDVVKGFGSYAQSDETGTTKEALNWRLLDIEDNEAVLMTDTIVDSAAFNLNSTDGNDWENSNLRSWLNSNGGQDAKGGTDGFYDTAFSEAEKAKISLTNVKMDYSSMAQWDTSLDDYNGTTGTYPAYDRVLYADGAIPSPWVLTTTTGESTQDYVYAISGEEYFEYFGAGYLEGDGWNLVNYRDGYFTATAYAKAQGVKVNTGGNGGDFVGYGDSWTRSPGREMDEDGNYYGVFWSGTGSMNVGRTVERTSYGILPMIRVDLIVEDDPGTSSDPSDSGTSSDPSDSGTSSDPSDPVASTDPSDSGTSTDPSNSDTSTDASNASSTSSDSSGNTTGANSSITSSVKTTPSTGDVIPFTIFISLICCGIIFSLALRKHRLTK